MKKLYQLTAAVLLLALAAGCGAKQADKQIEQQTAVQKVLEQQTGQAVPTPAPTPEPTPPSEPAPTTAPDSPVDYDLTAMNADMVFATVQQAVQNPTLYEGKTFRMRGRFSALYSSNLDRYYNMCVVKDATACCEQGLEFVWGDGSRAQEDYPPQDSEILVEGTFEIYHPDDDPSLYDIRFANAAVEVVS